MDLSSENAIRKALEYEQITSVDDLLDLDNHDIETLQYEENGSIKTIRKHQKGRLQSFKRYVMFLSSNGRTMINNWDTLVREDFQNFSISSLNDDNPKAPNKSMTIAGINIDDSYNASPDLSYKTKRTPDLLREFKKGIKRDPNLFPVLTRESGWDNFHQSLIIEAKAQDLEDVINPSFTPKSDDESKPFNEKQKFMCSVFKRTLQTDKGKSIVRKYATSSNARQIIILILKHII